MFEANKQFNNRHITTTTTFFSSIIPKYSCREL